jgi:hypothetical protein
MAYMASTIRQTIKVQEEGRLEVRSPDLHSGTTAQVTILIEKQDNHSRTRLLAELQDSLKLSAEDADAWINRVHDERLANYRDPAR